MKKTLLISTLLLTAASASAALPAEVVLTGAALAEEATVECTKISDTRYEAFALLNGGESLTVSGTTISATPGSKGVYRIIVNGDNNSMDIKKIEYFALRQNWTQREFILSYAGNGTWSGLVDWNELDAKDTRYLLALHYVRDDQRAYMFAPVNGTDATYNGEPDYFDMKDTGKVRNRRNDDPADLELGQWADRVWWKISPEFAGASTPFVCTVTMRGSKFTHSFAQCLAAPASLTATGSAVAEGRLIVFNKVNPYTYEAFARLKTGELEISDGTRSYGISGYKLASGTTTVEKDGVYCININFANNVASVKEVTSLRIFHLMSFGPIGESLNYAGNGVWTGTVDIPAGDDRYRLEMQLDGEYQNWGPTISGLDSAPNGDADYFNLKRVPWTYWDNKYKFASNIKGTSSPMTVKFNATPYTHSFEAYAGIADEYITDQENAPVEYYNLQGIRVANPESGLYIRRQGNKTTKVLVSPK